MSDKIPVCVCPFCGQSGYIDKRTYYDVSGCSNQECFIYQVATKTTTWQNAHAWKLVRELLLVVESYEKYATGMAEDVDDSWAHEVQDVRKLIEKAEMALGEK